MNDEKLFSGQLPIRPVIGLVGNEAFNGASNKNSFNFRQLMESFTYSDGQQQCGIKPLTTDFANELYV